MVGPNWSRPPAGISTMPWPGGGGTMGLGRTCHALMRQVSLMSKFETVSWLLTTSVARLSSSEASERFPVSTTVVKLVISTA